MQDEATELEFLRWFFSYTDFGPADFEVKASLMQEFEFDQKMRVPTDYREGYLPEDTDYIRE